MPRVRADGRTSVPGVYATGGLTGVPTIAAALRSGAEVAARIAADPALRSAGAPAGTLDLVIVGGGVAGLAAALEAQRRGLDFAVLEAAVPFWRIIDGAPRPAGGRAARPDEAAGAEELLGPLRVQVAQAAIRPRIATVERVEQAQGHLQVVLAEGPPVPARRVILATGRFGCSRRLGVPGDDLPHVLDRLDDARRHQGRRVVVVGGGEHSARAAIALAEAGAQVTFVYRGAVLTRPRYRTLARLSELLAGAPLEPWRKRSAAATIARRAPGPGTVTLRLVSRVHEIRVDEVLLQEGSGPVETVPAETVWVMIGRLSPADLARRSGLALSRGRRRG
jgi:thioredoxin reductase